MCWQKIIHYTFSLAKLGVCLSYTSLDVEAVNLLQQCVEEFLTYEYSIKI